MPELFAVPLISKNGVRGNVVTASRLLDDAPEKTVVFESGRKAVVPSQNLHLQRDGSYYLDLTVDPRGPDDIPQPQAEPRENVQQDGDVVIPLVQEQLVVGKSETETGRVRVTKRVVEYPTTFEETTAFESYEVERVPLDRVVEQTSGPRTEGDVIIIPVYEEEVVLVKRLRLREEIRLVKKRREERSPRTIVLKKEEVVVERYPASSATSSQT